MVKKTVARATVKPVLKKRIELTPLKKEHFKPKPNTQKPSVNTQVDEIFLSDFVAAIRRELEAVALIAASEESEIPQLSLSEVNLDFSYVVSSVTSEGVLIKIRPDQLADGSANGVQRIGLKLTDIDVVSAVDLAERPDK